MALVRRRVRPSFYRNTLYWETYPTKTSMLDCFCKFFAFFQSTCPNNWFTLLCSPGRNYISVNLSIFPCESCYSSRFNVCSILLRRHHGCMRQILSYERIQLYQTNTCDEVMCKMNIDFFQTSASLQIRNFGVRVLPKLTMRPIGEGVFIGEVVF